MSVSHVSLNVTSYHSTQDAGCGKPERRWLSPKYQNPERGTPVLLPHGVPTSLSSGAARARAAHPAGGRRPRRAAAAPGRLAHGTRRPVRPRFAVLFEETAVTKWVGTCHRSQPGSAPDVHGELDGRPRHPQPREAVGGKAAAHSTRMFGRVHGRAAEPAPHQRLPCCPGELPSSGAPSSTFP